MTLLDTVYDYIVKYTDINGDKIYRGWQNRMALPTTNDYIVYYVRDTLRHGTNVEKWRGEEEKIDNDVLREYTITIDVYDVEHDRGLRRIQALETMARSTDAIKFFRNEGYFLQYADDFRSIPFTDSNNQYIYRYNLEIHISAWDTIAVDQDFAKEVKVQKYIYVEDPKTHIVSKRNVFANVDEYLHP